MRQVHTRFNAKFDDYAVESRRNGGFINTGIALFDSEDLTAALLEIFLGMMANGWQATQVTIPMPIDGLGGMYLDGLWLPCVSRYALECEVDVRNDGMPDVAALPIHREDGKWNFVSARKVKLPRGWASAGLPRACYLFGLLSPHDGSSDRETRRQISGEPPMNWDGWYYSVVGDRVVPMRSPWGEFPHGGPAAGVARYGAAALQTVSDFRHLWVVQTSEAVFGDDTRRTPLRLGVTPDVLRSLFYARSLPTTESGRRRPILHWVRAHLRRLKLGIEIDIAKHLRGITAFEMDGFEFDITQPTKPGGQP
jgi:hypothetical protein